MNPQMMELLVSKLPSILRLQWGEAAAACRPHLPDLTHFASWLEDRAEAASFVYIPKNNDTDGQRKYSKEDHTHGSRG